MTQKSPKGGAVKAVGAKGGHNVAKGGFQKPKAGAVQKGFIGKKDVKPLGKAGAPKQQKATPGKKQPIGGKGKQGKKGKLDDDEDEDDEDDDEDEDDEDMDDDEEMDDEDDEDDDDDDDDDNDDSEDEELSDEEMPPQKKKQQQQPPQKQPAKEALTPKSILKNTSNTTPKTDDDKVPKLVPIASEPAKTKGQQAKKTEIVAADKSKAKDGQKQAETENKAFKLIANVTSEPLTAAQRGEFETRVHRISSSTVFVKGLHRRCTEDELRKLVKDVISMRLPMHEKRGSRAERIRGYAFLEFKDEATAKRNVDFLNKEAKLLNAESQPCKLEASISSVGGYVMSPDDWNIGSLYVSGLRGRATEDDVTALFERDQVVTVVLPHNRHTGGLRSCAHVRFRSADSAIRQFDAARAKILRGEFNIGGHALSIGFSSRQTLKRERAEHKQSAADASGKKQVVADIKPTPKAAAQNTSVAKATPVQNQTPKTAAQNNSVTKSQSKPTPGAVANKSLNESIVKKQAATPVQTSAQKGAATKRKLEEESARKAKMAKRDEEEDDDEEDDDDDEDDDE